MDTIERARQERKKASEFPQGLLDLLDSYVHGVIGRREFMARAQVYATGAVSAAALVSMHKPMYAGAYQVTEDVKVNNTEKCSVPSPNGNGHIDCYLVRPANA